MLGDMQDFMGESNEWFVQYGYGTAYPVTEVIRYEMYHECPLCDMSAISRGAVHSVLVCPKCGLDMIVSTNRSEDELA
jgi:uncharacterized protein (DUF983 family)